MNPLERIINTLLLNASFIDNIGLMNGKMGIAITFYHLARKTGNTIYEDYAGELIDEIYEEISVNTPCDFENGLAGIGWGIEYLVQNGFIEADTNEVLSEFDERLLHEFTFHFTGGINLTNGLAGYIAYFAMRIRNNSDVRVIPQTVTDTFTRLLSELQKQIPQLTHYYCHNQSCSTIRTTGTTGTTGTTETKETDFSTLPALFLSLSDIYIPASTEIKNKLIDSLASNFKNPEGLFEKLLLYFAFIRLKMPVNTGLSPGNAEFIKKTIEDLTGQILMDTQPAASFKLAGGTSGIAVLCHCIFSYTQNSLFSQKAQEWVQNAMSFQSPEESVFAGFKSEDENAGFGLVNGIAGIILANTFITDNLTSYHSSHD